MTSIIKVDQIQTPSGTVPTAADLGLNVAGSVLQVKNDTSTTQVVNASQGWTNAGLSLTITPQSATNYFWVMFEGYFSSPDTTSDKGYGFNIYANNSSVTSSANDGFDRPYDFYQDGAGRFFNRDTKVYYGLTGTTSPVTWTVKFTGYNYGSQGNVVLNLDSESQHSITVMEIAG